VIKHRDNTLAEEFESRGVIILLQVGGGGLAGYDGIIIVRLNCAEPGALQGEMTLG